MSDKAKQGSTVTMTPRQWLDALADAWAVGWQAGYENYKSGTTPPNPYRIGGDA